MSIYLRNRVWGSVALVAATVLAVGRVAIGVHFPSDVLAGAVLGCGIALILYAAPLRGQIDRLADLLGGWIESAVYYVLRYYVRRSSVAVWQRRNAPRPLPGDDRTTRPS